MVIDYIILILTGLTLYLALDNVFNQINKKIKVSRWSTYSITALIIMIAITVSKIRFTAL